MSGLLMCFPGTEQKPLLASHCALFKVVFQGQITSGPFTIPPTSSIPLFLPPFFPLFFPFLSIIFRASAGLGHWEGVGSGVSGSPELHGQLVQSIGESASGLIMHKHVTNTYGTYIHTYIY